MIPKEKHIIFFCGKGGVGKTTCAASTAIKIANAGFKTLLFSTDPAHSIGDSLEQPLTNKVNPVRNISGLFAIEINASSELKLFIKTYQKEINDFLKTETNLDSEDINDLMLLTLPGVDELMAIKKIIDFMELENDFKFIVCDTAPTGHALRLISMPDIVTEWIKVLANLQWKYKYIMSRFSDNIVDDNQLLYILKKMVSRVKTVLKNPIQTVFNVVTIPEAMSIFETKRLIYSLNKMNIVVQNLIINNVIPDNNQCTFCSSSRNSQNIYIEELKHSFTNIHIITKLRHSSEIKGMNNLVKFSEDLTLWGG